MTWPVVENLLNMAVNLRQFFNLFIVHVYLLSDCDVLKVEKTILYVAQIQYYVQCIRTIFTIIILIVLRTVSDF